MTKRLQLQRERGADDASAEYEHITSVCCVCHGSEPAASGRLLRCQQLVHVLNGLRRCISQSAHKR
jgi:hypothetical protein